MTKDREFLNNNRDQFLKLGRLINNIDTIKDIKTIEEARGRQIAIYLINSWIQELWGVELEEIKQEKEEDIIKIIK